MKKYMKCRWNTYETVDNSGWIKTAPLTIGKIYEILGETQTWSKPSYIITPDETDSWNETYARMSGKTPEYAYYKSLFEEPTEDELKQYLREDKINTILNG